MHKRLILLALALGLFDCSRGAKYGAAPIPQPQTVSAWCIDEVNGSDGNSGTTAGNCFQTWHQLNDAIWGCFGSPAGCPRLRQNTTVTFYNAGDATGADPIAVMPSLEAGKYLSLIGVPYGCTADTLRLVAAGGSATRTGLQTATLNTLDAATAGMFLSETTADAGVNSLGWGIAPSGGGTGAVWMWSQPLARTTIPSVLGVLPQEQSNTWANSDAVSYCSLPKAAIYKAKPALEHAGTYSGSAVYISNLNIVSEAPTSDAGAAIAPLNINANVNLYEDYVGRPLFVAGDEDAPGPQYLVNDYFASGVYVEGSSQSTWIAGGTAVGSVVGANVVLDGDTYLQASSNTVASAAGVNSTLATVALQDAATLNILGPTTVAQPGFYDAGVVWSNGPAAPLNVVGNSRLAYSGANTARFVGLSFRLNGQQKACVSNAVLAAACGIALSAATLTGNLDYDAGVEPGCLTAGPAGGGICNMGDSGAGL